ncbi:MAG: protein arginine kinase [Clostridia bacterium]|nr:protein arginine kinase [Clostridia bacterium]
MGAWYIESGPEADVVISSRVRLARNFSNYPFPFRMTKEQEKKVLAEATDAVLNGNSAISKDFVFVDIQTLNPIERQIMVEKHLVSPQLAEGQRTSGALVSRDEKISIMVNEEDHLRIQCLFPGFQIEKAWDLCNKLDTLLEERIDMAFDSHFGYLTCCPTNIGTGIRASAMLHLPALMMTGYIRSILEACSKMGVAVRGLYGENTEASGNMFQISNQVTLGQDEEEIIAGITNITSQIIEQERMLRNELYKQNPFRFEDKVQRSLGALKHSRIMSSEEAMKLLSDVRLGVDMGIIKNINGETLNEIILVSQSASLQKSVGKQLTPDERDIKRAELIRNKLKLAD